MKALEPLLDDLRAIEIGGHSIRDWSVYLSENRGLSLGIKDREVGNPHAPLRLGESCGVNYRLVWDDGKVSRGYLERRRLDDGRRDAIEESRLHAYDDPDLAWVVGPAEFPEVETHDAAAAAIAAGDAGALAERLDHIRALANVLDLATWSGSFSAGSGESRIVTSAGLDACSSGTSIGWQLTLNGEIGDGYSGRRADSMREFDDRLQRLGRYARLLTRPATAPAPGIHPILLHPHVVQSYVIGTLFSNLSGAGVSNGEGHFRREQFGSGVAVMRGDIELRIDPLLPMRSGSYRFTTQGVPAAACSFIEGGCLVQPVLDLKYARRLGMRPTPLPSGSDTLFFEGGEPLSETQAMAQAKDGVLVLSVLGVHTQDSASGDFSLSAPQALALNDGEPVGRLRGTISGNIFELLRSPELRFVAVPGEQIPGLLLHCRFDAQ